MVNKVPESVKREMLQALTYPEFKFFQDMDEFTEKVVKSLASQIRTEVNLWMPFEMLIKLHKSVLLKEVIYGSEENTKRILNILFNIRENKTITAYLKQVPTELLQSAESLARSKKQIVLCDVVEINKKSERLTAIINEFLEY